MQAEDSLAKQHLKEAVKAIMQPELNEPYLEPQPPFRKGLSSDAGHYRERNWGTLWLESFPVKHHSMADATIQPPTPTTRPLSAAADGGRASGQKHRIVGKEAVANQRRSQEGSVGGVLVHAVSGSSDEHPEEQQARTRLPTEEAKRNESRHRGSTMRGCLDEEHNAKRTLEKPRMKLPTKEAEKNYERNQGTVFKGDPYLVSVPSKPEQPATKSCSGKSQWNTGVCALVIAGKVAGDPTPAARVKGEGMDIYLRALGSRTLLHHGTDQSTVQAPVKAKAAAQSANREPRCYSAPPSKERREARRYSRKHPATVLDCMRRYL